MNEFVMLIKGDGEYVGFTEEEVKTYEIRYQKWMEENLNNGYYVWGQPLKTEGLHLKNQDNIISDGPFLEPKELIGGIIIIKADSLEMAKEIAQSCPLLDDFEIFIRPVVTRN